MSSWKREDDADGLRFQYKYCYCKQKAEVKIVDSDKPSKGKLYFVCQRRECGFWAWCVPLKQVAKMPPQDMEMCPAESSFESMDNGTTAIRQKIEDVRMGYCGATSKRLEKLEKILHYLTLILCFSSVLACLAIIISCLK